MKAKDIQELIDFISKSDLDEVNIETDDFKISVKRNTTQAIQQVVSTPSIATTPAIVETAPQSLKTNSDKTPEAQTSTSQEEEKEYLEVKSPMIGTFYRSPNPESPAFVNVGDTIQAGQVVCIVEAMKLFNEIESEVSGKVVKVLVENSSPVEYDQPLFLVEPQ